MGTGGTNQITRAGLADEIDALDADIKTLNGSKSDAYKAYREQLEAGGMEPRRAAAEVAATKAAIARRRKLKEDPEAVHEKDGLIDDILAEIMHPSRARERTADGITQNASNSGPLVRKSRQSSITPGEDTAVAHAQITEPAGPLPAVAGDADLPKGDASSANSSQPANGETDGTRDGGQHVRPAHDEQHDAAPVPRPDGRREGQDAGDQGPGAEALGADRLVRPVAGTVARQDEDGRSGHVGREARHEVATEAAPEPAGAPAPAAPWRSDVQRAVEDVMAGRSEGPAQVPRPDGCKTPNACASTTWRRRCWTCEKAWSARHGEAA